MTLSDLLSSRVICFVLCMNTLFLRTKKDEPVHPQRNGIHPDTRSFCLPTTLIHQSILYSLFDR